MKHDPFAPEIIAAGGVDGRDERGHDGSRQKSQKTTANAISAQLPTHSVRPSHRAFLNGHRKR